jgi:hypothetical protein
MDNVEKSLLNLNIKDNDFDDNIIKIQKIIRCKIVYNKYNKIINLKTRITPSKLQTKNWRKNQKWYINGKKNECEIYQRKCMIDIVNKNIEKTNIRLNILNLNLEKKTKPLNEIDGLFYTEDFDGMWKYNCKIFYLNLKFICNSGGAQTRALRETNHFILAQHNYLIKSSRKDIYFINIIDGDNGYKYIYDNFKNKKASLKDIQLNKKYEEIISNIFIGDTYNFINWYYSFNKR